MKKEKVAALLLLVSFSITAQVKGVVKDSVSGKPIPYVNVWIQNENIGTTAEENGEFTINTSDKNKNLIFSALGFEKKIIRAGSTSVVELKPTVYQLEEVIIPEQRLETQELEIGQTENKTYQAFDNGPKIDAKFFPYKKEYKKTKFIKEVSIQTDSKISEAIIKIHFYSVKDDGFPGEELLTKDYIVSVKKGVRKTYFNITELNLRMPKSGIFIGFEKLLIEKNKTEKTITDLNTKTTQIQKTYSPFVLYSLVEKKSAFIFSGGKWNKKTERDNSESSLKMKMHEPAINLTLTN
jgi:hypothetical protein